VHLALLEHRAGDALVTNCGCLGPCFDGPNAVVYPDGVWYAGLEPGDAAGLADHLASGRVLAAKLSYRPGAEPGSDPTSAGRAGPPDRDRAVSDAADDEERDAGRR
jgi:(2Fe-2S) ferredoxin